MAARPYQVIIWGASGFTGRLVCEHIAAEYQGQLRWAMAGRNKGKLETVRTDISTINESCKDVPIVVADAADQQSVDEMVSQADIVVACAGPFRKYSDAVVDASVRMGTHYCDITGEVLWVRQNVLKHHEEATKKQVKIVHCCGFDSVPFDLGTLYVVDHVKKRYNKGCKKVSAFVRDAYGGVSGGTTASAMDMMSTLGSEEMAAMGDPYSLNPPGSRRGDDVDQRLMKWEPKAGFWTAPSIMQDVNTRVVRRSNALLNGAYGSEFSCSESIQASSFPVGALMTGGYLLAGAVFSFGWLRGIAKRFLPSPGEGPSKETQLKGHFDIMCMAETEGSPSQVVKASMSDRRDPGYWSTSRMILECALCQVFDKEKLAEADVLSGGVLTPATAFGLVAIDRLRKAGYKFEILE